MQTEMPKPYLQPQIVEPQVELRSNKRRRDRLDESDVPSQLCSTSNAKVIKL